MRYERYFFLAAMVLYVIAAWFSSGFYHGDEHYSIIEYAAYKMGSVSSDQLTWYFGARIRSALQPFIAFIIIKLLQVFSIADPYMQTFVLRLLTALMAVLTIRYFTRTCSYLVNPRYHKAYLYLSYFLWFLPLVNVRFMSETWSGLMLTMALSVLLSTKLRGNRNYLAGVFLGLSFLFRYQSVFLALGIFLWLSLIEREKILDLLKLLAAGAAVLLLGILLDFWLYGEFTLTAWNYFYVNLVEGVASGYGTEAWWNYFYSIFRFGFFPIGIIIILAFLTLIIKKPRSVFTWSILPFFIIHSIIAHKELRFLFPVVNLVPIILLMAFQALKWDVRKWKVYRRMAIHLVIWALVIINSIGALTVCLKPSDGGLATITQHIRQHHGDEAIRLISYNNSNPYGPVGLMATFYMEKDMQDIRLRSLDELEESVLHDKRVNLLVLKREDAASPLARDFLTGHHARKMVQGIPGWMEPLMTLYGGFRVHEILELYEIPTQ
jgi:phosphatidylinositol glycan class B